MTKADSTQVKIGDSIVFLTKEHISILKLFRERQTLTLDEIRKALRRNKKTETVVQMIQILKGKGLIRREVRSRGIYTRSFKGKQVIQSLALKGKLK